MPPPCHWVGSMKLPGASRTPPPTSPHVRGVGGEQCSPVQFGGHATLRGRAMLAPQISTYPMRADDQHRPLQNEGRDIWPRKGANGEGSKSVKKNAALLHFLAFGPFDHLFGVLRGEQPLSRAPRLGSSGTFLLLFWSQKRRESGGRPLKKALPQGRQGRQGAPTPPNFVRLAQI